MQACPPQYVALAEQLADAARPIVRKHFRQPIPVEVKADRSPVTEADRQTELAMRHLIEEHCPDHGIVGEELGSVRPDAEWCWYLDPIDGTKSFVSGSPLFGTLIGLIHDGDSVLGLLDQAVLSERWLAHGATPTTLNGRPVRTRRGVPLERAILYTSGLEYYAAAERSGLQRIMTAVGFTRFSADCYAFGLMACGFVDVVIESGLNPHDLAALIPIVRNAGGVLSEWSGNPATQASDKVVAVADPQLLERVVGLLA